MFSINQNLESHQSAANDLTDTKVTDCVTFTLNGRPQNVSTATVSTNTTLNDYLREHLNLTGTKFMCRKGSCGACVVSATIKHPKTGVLHTGAVNSCLVNILSCQDWEITTVEGVGNRQDGLHALQQKVVDFNAAQCGFCTPGMVMSMYAMREGGASLTPERVEHAMGGNICRCTGYRSLINAFKSAALEDIEEIPRCYENCNKTCADEAFCTERDSIEVFRTLGVQKWYRPKTIKDIFTIFRQNRGRYALVAGNTAKGIYDDIMNVDYCIDTSFVADLYGYDLGTKRLAIGANTTISKAIEIFLSYAKKDDDFRHLKKCAEHLNLVASVPINNMATLAGNLATKYAHNEFPSDVYLLLEAIGALLVIDNNTTRTKLTPLQYLSYNMQNKIIRRIELLPMDASTKFDSYKIMPHAQNAVAILNACFAIQLNSTNVVTKATVVYGGISSTFTHARSLEKFLVGKSLFKNANLKTAFDILNNELQPDDVVPPIDASFRRKLAIALFYKFVLSIAPKSEVNAIYQSGAARLTRPLATGSVKYKINDALTPVGKPLGKIDVADMASGAVQYISDMPDLPGQLYAVLVLAKAAPGSILKAIDASNALAIDGVEAFLQATDIDALGGVNSFMVPNDEDEEVFLSLNKAVMFHSQPVGMILATNRQLAENASKMVEVTFDDATSVPLMSIQEVLKHSATDRVHHEQQIVPSHQDLSDGVVIKGNQTFGWQYHYFMELCAAIAIPTDDDRLLLHPSTQWADLVQRAVARCLNIKTNRITVQNHRLGGGFGGKLNRHITAVASALAAHTLRKPVKLLVPMETQMSINGKRSAVFNQFEVGVDVAGVIKYLNNSYYADMGAYGNALYSSYMLDVYLNSYVNATFQADTYWVRTDHPAATSMRAPGSIAGGAMIESILEQIASKLGKDPLEVKLENLNATKHAQLKEMIDDCVKWSNYRSRRQKIDEFNKVNRWRKRGISIVPLTYGLFFEKPMHVQVTVYQADGAVEVVHGGVEMGQGINTKVTQAAAYLLGVDINMIRVTYGNNFTSPNNMTTGGSITTDSVCKALNTACANLKKRINDATTSLPNDATWLKKVQTAFQNGVNLTENATFGEDPNKSSNYYIYAVAVCEIELDVLTGGHLVTRVDILADSGDSLNPLIDVGQIEGAFVMGQGYWTMEEIVTNGANGALLTNNAWTYKVPGAKDIPVDMRVRLAEGVPNNKNALRNKVVTQPPICLAVGVPLALRHAMQSVRTAANPSAEPWAPMDGPSTVEWTFENCLNNYRQYLLQ